ncbi:unnamed protein product [Withania somnifera]
MAELCRSNIFFSDQHFCYADILPPSQISRKSSNSKMSRGLLTGDSWTLSFCKRSLMRENSAKSFIRVWKVMELCYQILVKEKRVTQRELYYKLLCDSPDYFTSQLQEPNKEVVDCSTCGYSGYAISGDLDLLEKLTKETDARYIIMVEKHAIFQGLAEDREFNQIPCILIIAKGFPDIATSEFLLHRMCRMFPNLPVLGLVDWNSAGLAILCTFKFGSIGMGLEAYRYASNVKWSGLRKDDINQLIPEESLDGYKEEVAAMVQSGQRAEIEALCCHGYDY